MKHMALFLRCLSLLLAALLCGAPALGEAAATYDIIYSSENPIPAIAAAVRPAIVQITTSAEDWDPMTRKASVEPIGYGSACYIRAAEDGGYLLTNYHVVQEGDLFSALWLDGTETDVELVGYDDGSDIAVLKFEGAVPGDAQPIPLGDSDALQIGELAICIGNPGTAMEMLPGTVTNRYVKDLNRPVKTNMVDEIRKIDFEELRKTW